MHNEKYYIALDNDEKSLIIKGLNKLRTKQLNADKDVTAVAMLN